MASPRADDTASPVRAAIVVSATLIGQQVAGKAVRDALFLSSFDVSRLPLVMVVSAMVSLAGALYLSRLLARRSPAKVVPILLSLSGAAMALEWGLARQSPKIGALAVYLHMSLFGAAILSGFWSLFNERFDPHTAKRVVARVTAAGTLGGIAGGLLAWLAAGRIPVSAMLLVLSASHGISLLGALSLRPREPAVQIDRIDDGSPRSLRAFSGHPYLQSLGLLVLLSALVSTLLDYLLSARAASMGHGAELLAFFGLFQLGVGVAAFALSALVGRRALQRLGLAGTTQLAPLSVVAGGVVVLLAPGLVVAAIWRGSEAALRGSLFRAAYELFYTPLSPSTKRSTKALVDIGCDRLGTMVGSGMLVLVLRVLPRGAPIATAITSVLAMAGALATIGLARALQRGYVAALAESLRSGTVKLDEADVIDATTRRTLAETGVLDRELILKEIAVLRSVRPDAPSSAPPSLRGRAGGAPVDDPIARAIASLRSGDRERLRAALREHDPLPRELVPAVLSLVANDDVCEQAIALLRGASPRLTGQLIDALLDPHTDPVIQRRLPRIIAASPTQRAVDGLLLAFEVPTFEVRYRAARALVEVTAAGSGPKIDREVVLAEVERTLRDPSGEQHDGRRDAGRSQRPPSMDVDRRLDHAFSLLSLVFERDPLQVAWRALHQRDPRLRGTALEYLDNVLPHAIASSLRPLLGEASTPRPSRPQQVVLEELLKSSTEIDALSFDDP